MQGKCAITGLSLTCKIPTLINTLISFFPATGMKCCLFVYFLFEEYNIETESTIWSILYSFRPIRLQIFFTFAKNEDMYYFLINSMQEVC